MADGFVIGTDKDGNDITVRLPSEEEQNEALEALRQQAPRVVSVDALYGALDKSEFIYLTKNDVRNIVEGLL